MKSIVLGLFAALTLSAGSVSAASCETFFGQIVDPIQSTSSFGGGDHAYSGPNLEPYANLTNANLSYAYLPEVDLANAELRYAELYVADLTNANLN
ncbi:pentapeptide repeat-containing protein [Myxococcota bacterium]|nr:pentapeptide repeat-containing protein [Myxococcota bacterium]